MKRLLTSVAAAVLVLAGTGSAVSAQDMMVDRRAPRFDFGIYGGGAFTTPWYESRVLTSDAQGNLSEDGEGEEYGFGLTSAFGAAATLYFSPMFGLRLHYGYVPSELPIRDDEEFEDGLPLNNHFYDLNLVFRPFAASAGGILGQSYFFLGGGGLTSDLASTEAADQESENRVVCEPGGLSRGACLPVEPDAATVGQGTVGIGFDLLSLAANIGLFAELATHIYDSPVHVGDGFVPPVTVGVGETFAVADDRIASTTRFVAGLKLAVGNLAPAAAPLVVAPVPAPAPAPPAPAPPPADREIMVCVVEGNAVRNVTAMYNPTRGDTMVAGRSFSAAYPATVPTYAAGAPWFITSDELRLDDQEYVKFGVSRVIPATQLVAGGMVEGTAVFVESGATTPYQVVYVPVRPGCEFQPYQLRTTIRSRG